MHSIRKIAEYIEATSIIGNSDLIIKGLCGIDSGKDGYISYIDQEQYFKYLTITKASAIIVNNKLSNQDYDNKTLIKVDNASKAFSKLVYLFHDKPKHEHTISNSAVISDSVKLGLNVNIGHNVIIDENVVIGKNVFIGNGCYIGENSIIDDNSLLSNNITIVKNSKIGKNVKINSGTIIGGSGFGIFTKHKKHSIIPHIGSVIISDDVSIGSNCCIDRGTINDTQIGNNTHIDNLVQIAHNVKIGNGCIIAGQTGIAGSAIIGNFVTMGGQVGIVGHIEIADNVIIAGKSLVTKSIFKDDLISGIPAKNHKQRIKQEAIINRLPNMIKNIKK